MDVDRYMMRPLTLTQTRQIDYIWNKLTLQSNLHLQCIGLTQIHPEKQDFKGVKHWAEIKTKQHVLKM